jgi:membrane-associated phospholipid phosphatase
VIQPSQLLRSPARLLVGITASCVTASRVLLDVRHPSDVAAGVALGVAWANGTALLVRPPGTAVLRSSVSN